MASYVFSVYYGDTKQRRYVKHINTAWLYSERTMRFQYGFRKGWSKWSKWKEETGNVKIKDNDTITTPVGEAYRTDEIIAKVQKK